MCSLGYQKKVTIINHFWREERVEHRERSLRRMGLAGECVGVLTMEKHSEANIISASDNHVIFQLTFVCLRGTAECL